jgi:hypothetical protein
MGKTLNHSGSEPRLQAVGTFNGTHARVRILHRLKAGLRTFLWVAAAVTVWASTSSAEIIRVTTWNLGLDAHGPQSSAQLSEAARTLRSLDSDVILLQHVPDWRTCLDLAAALKPLNYAVLTCSAFEDFSPELGAQLQVAILSKRKAYFAWSDSWEPATAQGPACGAAFAAIQVGAQRLGFFTSLFGPSLSGDEVARRLLNEIGSVEHWEANQVQTFIVAASANPFVKHPPDVLRSSTVRLDQAAWVDATEDLPTELKGTLRARTGRTRETGDCLWARGLGFPSNTRIVTAPQFAHYPITTEVELDPDKVSTALDIRAENRRQQEVQAALTTRKIACWAAAAALGLAIAGGAWIRRRNRPRVSPQTLNPLPAPTGRIRAASPLRPVIFVEAPVKAAQQQPVVRKSNPKPALRLQTPPRSMAQEENPNPDSQRPRANAEPEEDGPKHVEVELQSKAPLPPRSLDPSVRHGVIQELSGWLKHKLVRKLVSDRAQLAQAQHLATQMATTLDNRLARIEAQIQKQNQAYLARIDELNRELAAAREENRELIQERIAQVKAEMEAARARVLAEANLSNSSLRL